MAGLSVCVKGKVTYPALAPKQGFNDAAELQWQMIGIRASVRLFTGSLAWAFLTTEGAEIMLVQSEDYVDFEEFSVSHLVNGTDIDLLFTKIRELREGDEFTSIGSLMMVKGVIRYRPVELDVIKHAAPALSSPRKILASQVASVGEPNGASFRDGATAGVPVKK